jgi:hypothetical protein
MVLLDYTPLIVGGCQRSVTVGQNILWAFDGFNKMYFLHLEGPSEAYVGVPFEVKVTSRNGQIRTPIEGATVGGATTNSNGVATITFQSAGIKTLKAEARCAVRSNAINVTVSTQG